MKLSPLTLLVLLLAQAISGCSSPQATASPMPQPSATKLPVFIPTEPSFLGPTQTPLSSPTPALIIEPPPPGLVFFSGGTIWKVDDHRRPVNIATLPTKYFHGVSMSPDEERAIVLAGDEPAQVIDLATGASSPIDIYQNLALCCPVWWPERQGVLVLEGEPGEEMTGMGFGSFPVIVDLGTQSALPITDIPASLGPFAPSPNGKFLAFEQRGLPWIYEWGKNARQLRVSTWGEGVPEDPIISHPSWSPDSSRIAWVLGGQAGDAWVSGVAILHLDSLTAQFFPGYDTEGFDGGRSRIIWSPTGEHFALWNFGQSLLSVLSSDGTPMMATEGASPQWSPDGEWLAFLGRTEASLEFSLTVVSADGSVSLPLRDARSYIWHASRNELIALPEDDGAPFIVAIPDLTYQRLDLPEDAHLLQWR